MPALLSAANKPLVCCPVRHSRPALNLATAGCVVDLLWIRDVVEEHFLSGDAAHAHTCGRSAGAGSPILFNGQL